MKKIIIISILFCAQAYAGQLIPWGYDKFIPIDFNSPIPGNYIDVSAGNRQILAIKEDGSLAAWGQNLYGECDVPDGNNFVKVAVGYGTNYALRSDGTLTGWGYNLDGRADVPEGNDFIDIEACIALKLDGSLVSWGGYAGDPPAGNDYIAISAWSHFLALKEDGSIIEWRQNYYGRDCNIPGKCDPPQGVFTKIAAGSRFSLAIDSDGFLVAWIWKEDEYGILNVPAGNDYVDIAAGWYHAVAIKSDGTLVAWGSNSEGQCNVPDGNDFVNVSANDGYSVALTSDTIRILTISTKPVGLDSVKPGQGKYDYYSGQKVYISAPRCAECPDVYQFDHWEGDIDEPNAESQYLTMNQDRTITAVYSADNRICGDECHPILIGDLNKDCYINFDDFAIYVSQWMECTHPDCD